MDEATIRTRIRRMLGAGEIPCEDPGVIWAGRGLNGRCVLCAQRITTGEIEFEVEMSGVTYRVHRRCYDIWQGECQPAQSR